MSNVSTAVNLENNEATCVANEATGKISISQNFKHWTENHSWFYKVLMLLIALSWGPGYLLGKDAVALISVNTLIAIRFGLSAVVLGVVFYRPLKKNFNWNHILSGVGLGVIMYLGYLFQTKGLQTTTPGKSAFLTSIYCVIVPFLYWIVDGHRPSRVNIIASFICLAGIGVISLGNGFSLSTGDLVTIVGAGFFAGSIVALSKLAHGRNIITITVFQLATVGAIAGVVAFFTEDMPPAESLMNTSVLSGLFYLIIVCTAIGRIAQSIGQEHMHPATASLLLSFESLFGAVFSVALGYEPMTGALLVGALLIFGSVIVSETRLDFLGRPAVKASEIDQELERISEVRTTRGFRFAQNKTI